MRTLLECIVVREVRAHWHAVAQRRGKRGIGFADWVLVGRRGVPRRPTRARHGWCLSHVTHRRHGRARHPPVQRDGAADAVTWMGPDAPVIGVVRLDALNSESVVPLIVPPDTTAVVAPLVCSGRKSTWLLTMIWYVPVVTEPLSGIVTVPDHVPSEHSFCSSATGGDGLPAESTAAGLGNRAPLAPWFAVARSAMSSAPGAGSGSGASSSWKLGVVSPLTRTETCRAAPPRLSFRVDTGEPCLTLTGAVLPGSAVP